jgi:hypothetical protein
VFTTGHGFSRLRAAKNIRELHVVDRRVAKGRAGIKDEVVALPAAVHKQSKAEMKLGD